MMNIKYLVILVILIMAIGVLLMFLRNRSWERLIENKQAEFAVTDGLKHKRSLVYGRALGVLVVGLAVSVITLTIPGQLAAATMDEAGSDDQNYVVRSSEYYAADDALAESACMDIPALWANAQATSDDPYVLNYDLGDETAVEDGELLEEMTLDYDGTAYSVSIYQAADQYYASFNDFGSIYQLILKK